MKDEQRAALRMLKRAQALGLMTKNGTPIVVDQMEELLAAAAGFRNRHAWRASVKETLEQASSETEQETLQKFEALEAVGVEISEDSSQPGFWVWTAPTDMSDTGFASKAEALANAWDSAVCDVCAKEDLSLEQWSALKLATQCTMVRDLYGD